MADSPHPEDASRAAQGVLAYDADRRLAFR